MVYQGTVLGPSLWNAVYSDSRRAIRATGFLEIIFADDLNAWKKYKPETAHETMFRDMGKCQTELHQWGEANIVVFDRGKEGMFTLSRKRPHGDNFELLGVNFDCKLVMHDTVHELAQ